jgi:hypothetical protein
MLETVRLVFISFVFWFSKRKYEVKSPSYSGRNISHQSIFLKLYVFTFFFFISFSLYVFLSFYFPSYSLLYTSYTFSMLFGFFGFFLFFFSFLSLSLVALHKFSDFLLFHYIDPEGQSEREADISC